MGVREAVCFSTLVARTARFPTPALDFGTASFLSFPAGFKDNRLDMMLFLGVSFEKCVVCDAPHKGFKQVLQLVSTLHCYMHGF